MWFAKNPDGSRVFNHCCLWVDQTGMLIQSIADVSLGNAFEGVLRVGTIYIIRAFGLAVARNLYRACSLDLIMELSKTTSFQACVLPAADFPVESFESVPFSELPKRAGDNRILSGVVGQRVSITLWNELTTILDSVALIQADSIEPVIIAVGSLMVGRLIEGEYTCSSSSATRIVVSPRIPEAYSLTTFFAGARNPVAGLPIQFATHEAALADVDRRTRTRLELHDLYRAGASVDEKHRCGGIVRSVESRSPWYKIQLVLRDSTREAPFIVFGPAGNNLVFTSAHVLAQRCPHRTGQLPPELSNLIGQFVRFEVKLPMMSANGVSTGEFRVFRVLPQDNQGLLPTVVAPVKTITDGTQGQLALQGTTEQCGVLMLTGPTESLHVSSSLSTPSSSTKGKAKVSGPLLFENSNPTFKIGQSVGQPLRSVGRWGGGGAGHVPLGTQTLSQPITIRASSVPAKQPSVSAVLGIQNPILGVPAGSPDPVCLGFVGDKKIPEIRPSLPQGSVVDSMSSCEQPSLPSTGEVGKEFGTPKSKVGKSLSSSGTVMEEIGTPQSKISKTSSTSTPSSSPSANLLVSPLAKVKVEKLESSGSRGPESGSSDEPAQSPSAFSLENIASPQASVKKSSAKRLLMTPRKKPTTNKVLKRKLNGDSLSSGITDDTPSSFPQVLMDNTRINKKSRQLPFMLSVEDTELSGNISTITTPRDPYTTHMEGQTSRQNPPSNGLKKKSGFASKEQNWILDL
ncbi:unnamed protein product [Linum trigynum]|uniref:Uncharacterized protein n=1 Tax=Linum trigynum TaxID=586398 RepID=A0AAV2ERZ3_9ROSI